MKISISILFLLGLWSCGNPDPDSRSKHQKHIYAEDTINYSGLDTATFAGGCFWCVEAGFEQIKGVQAAVSGYAGGEKPDPVYDTELNPYEKFYPAVEYHQDYEEKHPNDRYIQNVSRPKINKVKEKFKERLKEE